MKGAKRQKQLAAKRAKKASYGQQSRTDEERKQLNPRVPYQRRKLNRLRGGPIAGRPVTPWWSTMAVRGFYTVRERAQLAEPSE